MDNPTLQRDPLVLARLEARALEGMARSLCEHSQQLLAMARARGVLTSREANLQVEVFAERRAQADELLQAADAPVHEARISRLERLVSALECSRDYFRSLQSTSSRQGAAGRGRGMYRWILAVLGLSLTLSGCGMAATGGAAATQGAAATEQAEAAAKQLDKVRADLDAAQTAAADARTAGEAAAD